MSETDRARSSRSQRIAESFRHPPPGAKAVAIATVSTFIVLAVAAFAVVNSPGWERVQTTFFDFDVFTRQDKCRERASVQRDLVE